MAVLVCLLSAVAAPAGRQSTPAPPRRDGADLVTIDFLALAENGRPVTWARRVETIGEVDAAAREGLDVDRPVVIDAVVDPAEYHAQNGAARAGR